MSDKHARTFLNIRYQPLAKKLKKLKKQICYFCLSVIAETLQKIENKSYILKNRKQKQNLVFGEIKTSESAIGSMF